MKFSLIAVRSVSDGLVAPQKIFVLSSHGLHDQPKFSASGYIYIRCCYSHSYDEVKSKKTMQVVDFHARRERQKCKHKQKSESDGLVGRLLLSRLFRDASCFWWFSVTYFFFA